MTLALFSCGGAIKKNPYLGRIPSVEKKYHGQIIELVEGIERSGDIANSLAYMNEFDRIEYEWENAINQEVRITNLSKAIPVEYPGPLPVRIPEAIIEHVSRGNLVLRFNIEAMDTIEDSRSLRMVFEALDKEGNPLNKTISVANNFDQKRLLPGNEWSLTGIWETEAIINLEDLDQIRVIRLEGMP
ncbi:MAG: hypothetical protein V2I46_00775 [Bacteroides sp.]|nr:hypothetical protein [Bacteroides sp.]